MEMKLTKLILCAVALAGLTATAEAQSGYTVAKDGDLFDYCVNNSSNSYKTFDKSLSLPAGVTASVRTSRYSEWTGALAGKGTLNIYAGGERCYIGTKDSKGATYPDWSRMTGSVHLYPYKEVVSSCGFYGLLLQSNTFVPDNEAQSRPNTLFSNKTLVMHSGSTLAAESGTRGFKIGELQMEAGSEIIGYYKKSSSNSYYVVGGLNTDGLLAGRIYAKESGNKVGLIKEGSGTYTLTGNDNCPTMMLWGISDNHSWRENKPLLYDASCQPKQAYYYVHAQLRKAAQKATSVLLPSADPDAEGPLYNLQGQKVQPGYRGIAVSRGRKVAITKL